MYLTRFITGPITNICMGLIVPLQENGMDRIV